MREQDNEAQPWWAAGVVGPRPWDDHRRRAGRFSTEDPRWRYRNDRDSPVVLDVPGHEVSPVEPGEEVAFVCAGDALLAVADPERPGGPLEAGRVEDLAEPYP